MDLDQKYKSFIHVDHLGLFLKSFFSPPNHLSFTFHFPFVGMAYKLLISSYF